MSAWIKHNTQKEKPSEDGVNDGVEIQLDPDRSDTFVRLTEHFPLIYELQRHQRCSSKSIIRKPATNNNRILLKTGGANVFLNRIPNKSLRYVRDLANTLIHTRWRWILLSLFLANAVAYIIFAFMWMFISVWNGDHQITDVSKKCVEGTTTFTGYLLLSIETLTTIGFGEIYPVDCHEGWVILTLQELVGVAIQGALVSAVYVKLAKPYNDLPLNLFSRRCVICLRDGKLSLIFRVRDFIGKFAIATNIKAYMCIRRTSEEGEDLPNFFLPLHLEPYGLLLWPLDVIHTIDEKSPLWEFSAHDILTNRFELMVVLQGESLVTGQPSQCKTSYLNSEILWGYRFVNCIAFDEHQEAYIIHTKKFNATIPSDIPMCSAKRLKEISHEISLESPQ